MNFLLHRYLAERDLGSALAGIGAMLPDLWRMADRRVRPASADLRVAATDDGLGAVLAGVRHHVQSDRWFHAADLFVEGERRTFVLLRDSGVEAPKIGLFAHIAWELCLDGALIRRDGLEATLQALRDGFAAAGAGPAGEAASQHHFARTGRTEEERRDFDTAMDRLFGEIARGPWIAGYQDGGGVARRIGGIRARLGFPPFAAADVARLGVALDQLAPHADAGLAALTTRP